MEHNANQITLRGNLSAPPTFSHENHGKQFYRFFLEVPRLSGVADTLPVIADKSLLESAGADPGGMLTVTGQIRSHNVRTDGRRHLMIFVFASALRGRRSAERRGAGGLPLPGTNLPPHAPWPGDLRRDAGGAEGVPAGGLSALHPLGQDGAGGFPVPYPG